MIVHDKWDYSSYTYDADICLAVLETKGNLSYSLKDEIICLPLSSEKSTFKLLPLALKLFINKM